jgi:hypothetical protein
MLVLIDSESSAMLESYRLSFSRFCSSLQELRRPSEMITTTIIFFHQVKVHFC